MKNMTLLAHIAHHGLPQFLQGSRDGTWAGGQEAEARQGQKRTR